MSMLTVPIHTLPFSQILKKGAKCKGVFSVGLRLVAREKTARLPLSATQSIGGTCAVPLGMPKPFTKYNCLCCALVYHITAPLSLGLICRMLVGKIPFGFKNARLLSSSVCKAFANISASFTVNGCAFIGVPLLSISKCSTYIFVSVPVVS